MEAYLDIETTGLYPPECAITVIGIYLVDGSDVRFTQLIGQDITADNLLAVLQGVSRLYTYNGSRFDLPFINACLGIDLSRLIEHCDLMYDCWRNNLYGGFKAVERQLGIARQLKGVNGYEAVRLWWRYKNDYDEAALSTLLEYNKEDVINLQRLREKLFFT